jgi:AcrR family transcriptional regulator
MDRYGSSYAHLPNALLIKVTHMNNRHRLYRIGQLERLTNVERRTILFYVEKGLLHPPVKTGKTMAYYDEAHYRKLKFIKNEKRKGLPLVAIRTMIEKRETEGNDFGPRLKNDFILEDRKEVKKKQPRKRVGKVTRERIVEEGSRIFQEKGFKDTRVNDIISRLNIGKGSFYSYFSNKEALFLECVPMIFEKFFSEGWEKIRKEKDPHKRLILRAEVTIPVIDEFITIMQLAQEALKEADPNLRELGEKIYRSVCRPIEADLVKGIQQGFFRAVNPRLYSSLMISIMAGIDTILTMNPDISAGTAKDALIDVLTRSVVKDKKALNNL